MPFEVHGLTLREPAADETADETARHGHGGSDCELASGQDRLQSSPFNSKEYEAEFMDRGAGRAFSG